MAYGPISFTAPQYEDYANWWLKAYEQGTTTPTSMAQDSAGASPVSKYEISSAGFPVTSGGVIVNPHISVDYDLWLIPTEAEADANDTSNAFQLADNMTSSASVSSSSPAPYATLALAKAAITSADVDKTITTTEHTLGYGYEGGNSYLVASGTITDDNGSLIQGTTDTSVHLIGLFKNGSNPYQFGCAGDGVVDDTTAYTAWETYGGTVIYPGSHLVSGVTKIYSTVTYVNVGSDNHAAGYLALESASSGENNTAFGREALRYTEGALPLGSNNAGFGYQALGNNTGGYRSTAVGYQSCYSNTGTLVYGNSLTALGYQSLYYNDEGKDNTAIGYLSMFFTTGGGGNTAIGYRSLYSNTGTTDGTPTWAALDGSFNTTVGYESMLSNTLGNSNTATGWRSLFSNTTGVRNTAMGQEALRTNISGDNNVAVGYHALHDNTAANNTAVGYTALTNNSTGTLNVAVGRDAMTTNTTGSSNVAVGYQALNAIDAASLSTAVGRGALLVATAGSNTAIGYNAGSTMTTGTNNTFIGQSSAPSSVTVSNEITLGNSSVATLRCQQTTITSLSDERDKKDIEDLAEGIDFIMGMRPVEFKWDDRDGTKKRDKRIWLYCPRVASFRKCQKRKGVHQNRSREQPR